MSRSLPCLKILPIALAGLITTLGASGELIPIFGNHLLDNGTTRAYTGTTQVNREPPLTPLFPTIAVNEAAPTPETVDTLTGAKVTSTTSNYFDNIETRVLRIHNGHIQLLSWSDGAVSGTCRTQNPVNFLPLSIDNSLTIKTTQVGLYTIDNGSSLLDGEAKAHWLWLAEEVLTTLSGTLRCQKIDYEFEWRSLDDSLAGYTKSVQWWNAEVGLVQENVTIKTINGEDQLAAKPRTLTSHSIVGTIQVLVAPESTQSETQYQLTDANSGYDSGLIDVGTTTTLAPGTYTLAFPTSPNDWAAPPSETIEVTAAPDQSISRDLTAEFGSIKVNIEPPDLLSKGPVWALFQGNENKYPGGNSGYPAGQTVDDIPEGSYRLVYSSHPGWTSPAEQDITIAPGLQEITVTFTLISNEITLDMVHQTAAQQSPYLEGAVTNGAADVSMSLAGTTYPATNNDDGTWMIPQGTLPQLPEDTYNVIITAVMPNGQETTINSTFSIQLDPYAPAGNQSLQFPGTPIIVSLDGQFEDAALDLYRLETNVNSITLRLLTGITPRTVSNFKRYINTEIYDNAIFHKGTSASDPSPIGSDEISGGATETLHAGRFYLRPGSNGSESLFYIPAFAPIYNESSVPNDRGTLAMEKRTGVSNSATSEWFFNLSNNGPIFDTPDGGRTVFAMADTAADLAALDVLADHPRRIITLDDIVYPFPFLTDGAATLDNTVRMLSFTELPDRFTYSAASSDPSICTATINDQDELITTPGSTAGIALVTVTATAPDGRTGEWVQTVFNGAANTVFSGQVNCSGAGFAGVAVYVDLNENSQFDSGEPETVTTETGQWSFQLPAGDYRIQAISPPDGTIQPAFHDLTTAAPSADFNIIGDVITIDTTTTVYERPVIAGTTNSSQSDIAVTINEQTYAAQNNGDGTWTLPSDIVNSLDVGSYPITVSAGCATTASGTLEVTPAIYATAASPPLTLNAQSFPLPLSVIDFRDDRYQRYALDTPVGTIKLRLFSGQTPATVANFASYITSGAYADSIVHRAAGDDTPPSGTNQYTGGSTFVLQGGGFHVRPTGAGGSDAATTLPDTGTVINEPGISNIRGTIAMAKIGGQPNSATTEWFFNLGDNSFLDTTNGGFTVFGEIEDATDEATMDAMANLDRWSLPSPLSSFPVPLLDSYQDDNDYVPHLLRLTTVTALEDAFTYTAVSSDDTVCTVEISSGDVIMSPGIQQGTADVTVTATTPDGRTAIWVQTVTNETGAQTYSGYVNGDASGLAGITVFVDLNLDGAHNANEPIMTTQYDDPDTDVDELGRWQFELVSDDYRIQVVGSAPITFASSRNDVTSVSPNADFNASGTRSLAAFPFIDSDGSDTLNNDETPIADLPIQILRGNALVATIDSNMSLSIVPDTYTIFLDPDVANAAGYALGTEFTETPDANTQNLYIPMTEIAASNFALLLSPGMNLVSLPGSLVTPRSETALAGKRLFTAGGRRTTRADSFRPFRGYWLEHNGNAETINLSIYEDPRTEIVLPAGQQSYGPAATIPPIAPSRIFDGRQLILTEILTPGQAVINSAKTPRTVPVK